MFDYLKLICCALLSTIYLIAGIYAAQVTSDFGYTGHMALIGYSTAGLMIAGGFLFAGAMLLIRRS